MGRLIVTAAAAVLPTVDGREQYLYKGAIVDSDAFTEDGLEHARTQGLVDDAPEVVEEETPTAVFSQADIDEAVRAATSAKDADVARLQGELDAAKAEAAATPEPAKVPASKA